MSLIRKPLELFDRYFLSEKPAGVSIADINLSLRPSESINRLKNYRFTRWDICHYTFLASIWVFVLAILPVHFVFKMAIVLGLFTILVIPFTSQFFLNGLPVLTWVFLFFSASKIPSNWKPAISVKYLPMMETILYGDNLSNLLAASTNSFLDILAWLPYGIIHFSAPFVVAALIFLFAPPTSLRAFGFAFGYMNIIGVLIQLLSPAAPPWYKTLHGLNPANYTMNGSPGGLGRIDKLFGADIYTTTFNNSPVVFGALPSLHSGCSTMDALFLTYLFPKAAPVFCVYVLWLWWSTMYLTHHYFFDLTSGATLAFAVFIYTKYTHLPKMNPNCFCRWSYSVVEKNSLEDGNPLNGVGISSDLESNLQPSSRANFNEQNIELSRLSSRQTSFSNTQTPALNAGVPGRLRTVSPVSDSVSSVFDEDHDTRLPTSSSNTSLDELAAGPK